MEEPCRCNLRKQLVGRETAGPVGVVRFSPGRMRRDGDVPTLVLIARGLLATCAGCGGYLSTGLAGPAAVPTGRDRSAWSVGTGRGDCFSAGPSAPGHLTV